MQNALGVKSLLSGKGNCGCAANIADSYRYGRRKRKERKKMAMSCITSGKECTGCMACYDRREECEEEIQHPTEDEKKDIFQCFDGAKEAVMEMYDLDEEQAIDLLVEFIER